MQAVSLLFVLLVAPAAGASLRKRDSALSQGEPAKPADIKEKYDKMDEFMGVMFTMACKWKNGKDVFGAGKEALKKGKVDGADGYASFVKDLQAKNVKGLQRSCGMVVAEQKKQCRDGCAERWNAITAKRDECDEKCVKLYANFETSCMAKADGLVNVYKQKAAKAAGQKQCYEGHCKEFPMVWMKAEESEMKTAVTDQCKKRCTKDAIKSQCQKKWAVQVDMATAEVHSKCAEDSGVSDCFNKKKADTSKDYDKCKGDTEKSCGKDFDDCKKKGNTDKTFKDAEAFCTDRKKMCLDQADKKCVSENKAAINKAEKECEAEASKEMATCEDEALDKREKDAEKKCIADRTPTCKDDCKGMCQITKMNDCLKVMQEQEDPGKLFCQDFWDMLHASSEIDPITGNPKPSL